MNLWILFLIILGIFVGPPMIFYKLSVKDRPTKGKIKSITYHLVSHTYEIETVDKYGNVIKEEWTEPLPVKFLIFINKNRSTKTKIGFYEYRYIDK